MIFSVCDNEHTFIHVYSTVHIAVASAGRGFPDHAPARLVISIKSHKKSHKKIK